VSRCHRNEEIQPLSSGVDVCMDKRIHRLRRRSRRQLWQLCNMAADLCNHGGGGGIGGGPPMAQTVAVRRALRLRGSCSWLLSCAPLVTELLRPISSNRWFKLRRRPSTVFDGSSLLRTTGGHRIQFVELKLVSASCTNLGGLVSPDQRKEPISEFSQSRFATRGIPREYL